jgi:hypothetical protein
MRPSKPWPAPPRLPKFDIDKGYHQTGGSVSLQEKLLAKKRAADKKLIKREIEDIKLKLNDLVKEGYDSFTYSQ